MILYDELFSYQALEELLSDESVVKGMLRFEAALAKAEARAGVIPAGAANILAERCATIQIDTATLAKDSAAAGNVVIPLVKKITEAVAQQNKEAARFVHWGATSQDVIDTGLVLQLRDVLELLEEDLEKLSGSLADLAQKHRSTEMVARTWMQQALPTTFGYVVAGWLDAILRHRSRLVEMRPRVLVLQFGGAAGTLAALHGEGAKVAKALAEELGLALPPVPWHAHRDRVGEIAAFFGLLTGTLGKIARDIALHSQTEIAEVFEPAGEGRGSSSTMPHKRNPVTCAAVLAAATRMPGLVATVLSAMPQEYQRGLGGWQAEWETLPEVLRLGAGSLHRVAEMLPGLEVDAERMGQNLEATHGLIFAEAVTMALADRMGKMPAHLLVESACRKSLATKRPLNDVLREEPGLQGHLASADLESLFEARNYLGSANEFVDKVITENKEMPRTQEPAKNRRYKE